MCCEGLDWVHPLQCRGQRRALVKSNRCCITTGGGGYFRMDERLSASQSQFCFTGSSHGMYICIPISRYAVTYSTFRGRSTSVRWASDCTKNFFILKCTFLRAHVNVISFTATGKVQLFLARFPRNPSIFNRTTSRFCTPNFIQIDQ